MASPSICEDWRYSINDVGNWCCDIRLPFRRVDPKLVLELLEDLQTCIDRPTMNELRWEVTHDLVRAVCRLNVRQLHHEHERVDRQLIAALVREDGASGRGPSGPTERVPSAPPDPQAGLRRYAFFPLDCPQLE